MVGFLTSQDIGFSCLHYELGLECSTVCSRDVDVDSDIQKKSKTPLKCGYGEEWKRSAGLIKLLMRQFSGE